MILRSRPTLRSGILLFILWFILIVLGIVWHIDYRKYVSACTEQTAGIVTNIYVNESKRGRSGKTQWVIDAQNADGLHLFIRTAENNACRQKGTAGLRFTDKSE